MNCSRILAVFLLSTTLVRADLIIVQDVDAMGQKLTMTMKAKGSLVRIDMNPQMSMIMNTATGDMKTLMHDQKMFMTMNMEAMKGMIASATKSTEAGEKPVVKALGNHEKINGYDTEEYLFTQGKNVSHIWIAKDYPHFAAFTSAMDAMRKGPLGQVSPQLQMDMAQLPGMPVKTVTEVNGSTATSIVKSVDEKDLDAADFAPPTDYKSFAMPTMPAPNPQ